MCNNVSLQAAKANRNDEFFTRLSDIEIELPHYREHFRGRTVYCNCDCPETSNFWRFFAAHFEDYGLKRLIATFKGPNAYQSEMRFSGGCIIKTRHQLLQGGDFQSPECVQYLRQADIIVTNPPFSLWREYLSLLITHQKDFLIIGPMHAITYKTVFPMLQGGKLWLGNSAVQVFQTPGGDFCKFGNVFWYTNLDYPRRHILLPLSCRYSPELYPRYVNYDAIEVGKVALLPGDYDGAMGVPVSFLRRHCPAQFEILGLSNTVGAAIPEDLPRHLRGGIRFYLRDQDGNYRRMYERLVIRKK
jgi:hypothetical protein